MTTADSLNELVLHFPQAATLRKRYEPDNEPLVKGQDICRTAQDQLMLELAYAFLDIDQADAESFGRYSIALLVDYLKRTHSQYLKHDLPLMAYTIEQLVIQNPDDHRINYILQPLFRRFADDLHAHILWEENGIFPLALLAHASNSSHIHELPADFKSSLNTFLLQHPDHADELELIFKLIDQLGDCYKDDMAFRMLRKQIDELRKDLKLHHIIEEKVLMQKLLRL